eukprot:SAG22_NODE_1535_length_4200_cov_301.283346_3_plen_61_part_00
MHGWRYNLLMAWPAMKASGVSIVTTRSSAASATRTGFGSVNIPTCVSPSYLRWVLCVGKH